MRVSSTMRQLTPLVAGALITFAVFTQSATASHMPEGDAKYGPWWENVPDDKRLSVIKFCVNFLAANSLEQLEVFYFNEEKTFEAWKMCDWMEQHQLLYGKPEWEQ